ncbi:spermine/spermidine synthase [Pseudonocardia hierapolitana]|uniref:Spermine/spermidine synthase n=1 Tax=Pseudonocardia hierapolitana TaxID=1128676 RepID=A0A561T3M5_9PSEU|nr:spermidine synthase [Pseudonocardia hierapolitana]TWF81702.1 spermine/spermidine synthase [Pseudonocardia hierapolitana]
MSAEIVERTTGLAGELVLRRDGEHHEIVANGVFLMDTRGGSSERLLVTATADRMPPPGRMLIGGLGVGFSLAAALAHPAVTAVEVVEREAAVIRWNRGALAVLHGDALADPRVAVREADVADRITSAAPGSFDAICLDTDNGPDWLVSPANARLYTDTGLAAAARALAPGGVLAVWSAAPSPALAARMGGLFTEVTTLEVPMGRGGPDVVVLAAQPR